MVGGEAGTVIVMVTVEVAGAVTVEVAGAVVDADADATVATSWVAVVAADLRRKVMRLLSMRRMQTCRKLLVLGGVDSS